MTFVGIDVSKDRLDICILPQNEAFSVSRKPEGLAELIDRLKPLSPKLVMVEATGGYEMVVSAAIAAACLPLAVVNPAQVRHYAQALGKRAKSDPIDAHVLARFAADVKPDPRELPDEMTQLLADLVSRRRQIVEMIGAERQREKRAVIKRVKKSIARLVQSPRERTRRARQGSRRDRSWLSGLAREGRSACVCSRRWFEDGTGSSW